MREIKFKAFDKKNGCFIANGDVMNLYSCAKSNSFLFDNDNYDLNEDILFLQFTGLKDKNGKEIYEGDIVKKGKEVGYVFMDDYSRLQPFDFLSNHQSSEFKVIGNKFKNSEILE